MPGTSDVLNSNVLKAVLTLAGMPWRERAEPMQSLGLAMFSASMQSSTDASASIWRSVPKPLLPMAARVPFKSRNRRTTSPRTAMISGELKRPWQAASYGSSSVSKVYSSSSTLMRRRATSYENTLVPGEVII